ncbi:hypothetical protein [Streptomyces rhizosphaerihabitans]|uniref:hypothetical protein n=1 Tax=Streptomyces rhizosphaerihabitans TaxID=1266770 RepID=UPI0037049458
MDTVREVFEADGRTGAVVAPAAAVGEVFELGDRGAVGDADPAGALWSGVAVLWEPAPAEAAACPAPAG